MLATCSTKDLANPDKVQEIEKRVLELAESKRSDWIREQEEKAMMEKLTTCSECKSKNSTLNNITKDCVCLDCKHEWNIKEEIEEIEREKYEVNSEDESLSGGEDGGD